MNWKIWKRGMVIALMTGLFQAMVGWAVNLTPKQLVALFIVNMGIAGLAYLSKHPVESITDETTFSQKRTDADGTVTKTDTTRKTTTEMPPPFDNTKI